MHLPLLISCFIMMGKFQKKINPLKLLGSWSCQYWWNVLSRKMRSTVLISWGMAGLLMKNSPYFFFPVWFLFLFLKNSNNAKYSIPFNLNTQANIKITKRSQLSLCCPKLIGTMFPNRTTSAFQTSLYSIVNTVIHEERKSCQLYPLIAKPSLTEEIFF